jgi:probable HAF family extracellular repeat protein
MSGRKIRSALFMGAVVASLVTSEAQALDYQITTLPAGPTGASVQAFGISGAGRVAGAFGSALGQQAFIYSAGAYSLLSGPAGALGAAAFGVTDTGQVAGSFYDTQTVDPVTGAITIGPTHGFVLSGGIYTRIDVPDATFTQARGISPDGRYVSGYSTSAAGRSSAFVYDTSSGSFLNLGRPNSTNSLAQGVNAAGVVVGSDILSQPGSPSLRVGFTYDINTGARNDTAIAGYFRTAFRGINDSGTLAGWLQQVDASGALVTVGFAGTTSAYDVIAVPGATDTFAQSINNAGVVSGYYTVGDQSFGFLATPVPEPQTALLILAGLGLLAGLAKRRSTTP